MADFVEFFEFAGDEETADAFFAEIPHDLEDLLLGLEIDAAGGFVEEHDARVGVEPFAEDDFLLISAAE